MKELNVPTVMRKRNQEGRNFLLKGVFFPSWKFPGYLKGMESCTSAL
jgi:hypothetical protein